MAQNNITAVILAGGAARRMQGTPKGFLEIGGKSIVARLESVLTEIFPRTLLVLKSPDQLCGQPPTLPIVEDQFVDQSAMTGIHAGLFHSATQRNFICAWDMPFLQKKVVEALCAVSPTADIVVPEWEGRLQPLCAIYQKSCLPIFESAIAQKNYKIESVFPQLHVHIVPMAEIKKINPNGISFMNINRPEDLKIAQKLMEEAAPAR